MTTVNHSLPRNRVNSTQSVDDTSFRHLKLFLTATPVTLGAGGFVQTPPGAGTT
jgi:hypothetical protein